MVGPTSHECILGSPWALLTNGYRRIYGLEVLDAKSMFESSPAIEILISEGGKTTKFGNVAKTNGLF